MHETNEKVDDEFNSLLSIFCNEIEILNENSFLLTIYDYQLSFYVQNGYPFEIPRISFRSGPMSNADKESILIKCQEYARSLIGNSMLFELITWYKENLPVNTATNVEAKPEDQVMHQDLRRVVLRFDHMRNENSYVKTVQNLQESLNIAGVLIFCGRIILLIIEGTAEGLKEYKKLQRTLCVDVDSNGKKCKEHMMTELVDDKIQLLTIKGFRRVDLKTKNDLFVYLDSLNLSSLIRDVL